MVEKARVATLLTVLLCCAACSAPSLRYKKEVNAALAAGQFEAASQKIEKNKSSQYSSKDSLLYYLDAGAVLHDNGQVAASDELLAKAQDRAEELFTKSVSAHAGQYLINDLTVPYELAPYEQSLTYYYRAMNFLSLGKLQDAMVEANRAVYFLDQLRGSKSSGWRDDPFVQYFMSLVFESAGKRDDARIARERALQAYANVSGGKTNGMDFLFEKPAEGWGEIVLVHANGVVPLKKTETFQMGWNEFFVWTDGATESYRQVNPEVRNAIRSGLLGNSITLSYPVLEIQPYQIKSSEVITAQGKVYRTRLLGDVSGAAQADLKDRQAATLFRMAVRAATKRIAAVQARHAVAKSTDDKASGDLAEMVVNLIGTLTEKADTRQWFTLPAQLRMARFYVPPGKQDVVLRLRDGYGNIVGEYTFHDVIVPADGRVYLHYRTAK